MTPRTVYIAGAGLAGLAAAVALATKGVRVELFEAAAHAGGRCRSYFDAALGAMIDNGNHLLLSGNHAAHAYLRAIRSEGNFAGPKTAEFAFMDVSDGARWTIRPNESAVPWWIFIKERRVPDTTPTDYLKIARLLRA